MSRPLLAACMAIGLAQPSPVARAQGQGGFLERAAKDTLRKQLDPDHIERLRAPFQAGDVYSVKTADGWTLVAHRFRPGVPTPAGAVPVILCHGLSYNAQFWDLDPACS